VYVVATAVALPLIVVLTEFDVMMCEGLVTLVDPDSVVNAPVAGVVAPTVPLCGPTRPVLAVIVVPVMAAAAVPPMAGGDAK